MRTVHTLILRLLVDSDHPDALHGALQLVNKPTLVLPFRDAQALLVLLKRLSAEPAATDSAIDLKERKPKK